MSLFSKQQLSVTRFLKFYCSMIDGKNEVVPFIPGLLLLLKRVNGNSTRPIGRNIAMLTAGAMALNLESFSQCQF